MPKMTMVLQGEGARRDLDAHLHPDRCHSSIGVLGASVSRGLPACGRTAAEVADVGEEDGRSSWPCEQHNRRDERVAHGWSDGDVATRDPCVTRESCSKGNVFEVGACMRDCFFIGFGNQPAFTKAEGARASSSLDLAEISSTARSRRRLRLRQVARAAGILRSLRHPGERDLGKPEQDFKRGDRGPEP